MEAWCGFAGGSLVRFVRPAVPTTLLNTVEVFVVRCVARVARTCVRCAQRVLPLCVLRCDGSLGGRPRLSLLVKAAAPRTQAPVATVSAGRLYIAPCAYLTYGVPCPRCTPLDYFASGGIARARGACFVRFALSYDNINRL